MRRLATHLLLLLTLAVAACSPAAPSNPPGTGPATTGGGAAPTTAPPAEKKADPQILRVAVKGLLGNPTPQSSSFNFHLFWPYFDNLVQMEDGYVIKPSVATKWDLSQDGLSWRFTIRKDMKFSNGDPLTAEDVAFSVNTIVERNWPQKALIGTVTSAKVVDESTVDIVTRQLDVTIANAASFIWIIPKKYYESVGFDGFSAKPIGSGPYDLIEFKVADTMRFKKRATAHAFRNPVADELQFKVIPENSQILNGLQTGDIDVAIGVNWTGDQADQLKRLGMDIRAPLTIQVNAALPQGTWERLDSPLKDKRVRLAMNYAIDRQAIADKLFKGYAKPASQQASQGSIYFIPNLPPFPYDVAKAKQLLAEAGYPNGFTLTGGFDYTVGQTNPDIPVAIQSYLKAIGINIEVTASENAVFVDKAYGRNNLQKGDIFIGRGSDTIGFGPNRTFPGCGKPAGGSPGSVWYCNPEWDRLLDAAYAERDNAKRGQLMQQANKVQADDVTAILLYDEPNFVVATAKVRDMKLQHPIYFHFDSAFRVQ